MNNQLQQLEKTTPEHVSRTANRPVFTPRADIYEFENNFVVLADLPGADETTIDITVEKNVLAIHASSEYEAPEGHSLTYSEYAFGDYQRKFTLPNEIDREGITASMKNGVLKLVLPKNTQSLMKKIAVTAE